MRYINPISSFPWGVAGVEQFSSPRTSFEVQHSTLKGTNADEEDEEDDGSDCEPSTGLVFAKFPAIFQAGRMTSMAWLCC